MALPWLRPHLRLMGIALILGSVPATGACTADSVEPPGPPSLSLSVSPSSAVLAANGSVEIDVTVVRGGGFSGLMTVGMENVPSSVLTTFAPTTIPATASTSKLTLRVGPGPGLGNNTMTVVAFGVASDGLGLKGTRAFTLSIVAGIAPSNGTSP